jgi:23S rRNA (guanosine2251-2'-O)-methyltransferase
VIVILHNIRSVHNVGSIFRTADAAGVERILLSGYTPTPIDRFGRERSDLAKVALGAQLHVPWDYVKTLGLMLTKLKKEGYAIAAIEQYPRSTSLFDYRPPKGQKLALILGNEVRGISKPLLNKCDVILEIPMHGKKESLNVSVTAGIALFMLLHT